MNRRRIIAALAALSLPLPARAEPDPFPLMPRPNVEHRPTSRGLPNLWRVTHGERVTWFADDPVGNDALLRHLRTVTDSGSSN